MFVMTSIHDHNDIKPAIIFAGNNFVRALLRAEQELGTTDVVVNELGDNTDFCVIAGLGDNGEFEQDFA